MVCFVKLVTWFGKWCVPFEWLVKGNLNGVVITADVIISNIERNVEMSRELRPGLIKAISKISDVPWTGSSRVSLFGSNWFT